MTGKWVIGAVTVALCETEPPAASAAGSVAIWDMSDSNILATHDPGAVPSNWHILI